MLNKLPVSLNNGYISYYDKKLNKSIYEHDIISEVYNKHVKLPNESIHHLDLNRANNNPENLIFLDSGQHSKLHKWISKGMPINKKKVRTIEEALKESRRCAKAECNNIVVDKRNRYCSIECRKTDIEMDNRIKNYRINKRGEDLTARTDILKWPDVDDLVEIVKKHGFLASGKLIGVSDNAVRKRLKKFNKFEEVKKVLPPNRGWFKPKNKKI